MKISPITGRWVSFGQYKKDWETYHEAFPYKDMPPEDKELYSPNEIGVMCGMGDGISPIVKQSVNQQKVKDMFHEFWDPLTPSIEEINEKIRNASPEEVFQVMLDLGCGFDVVDNIDISKPRELPKLQKKGNVYPFICSQCKNCKMGNMGGGNIRRVKRINGLGSPARDIGYCMIRKEIVDSKWSCPFHNLKDKRKRGF